MGPQRGIATASKGYALHEHLYWVPIFLASGIPLAPMAPKGLIPTPAVALTLLGVCPWGWKLWDIAEVAAGSLCHHGKCPYV